MIETHNTLEIKTLVKILYSERLSSEYVCDSVAQIVNELQNEACLMD